ncbi:MAG: NUDIX domain-containing protein [Acidimicrobiales bacterium]
MTPPDPEEARHAAGTIRDVVPRLDRAAVVFDTTVEDFATFLTRRFDPAADIGEHLTAIAWPFDTSGAAILLVDHPVMGWSCPGGHVEVGERPAAAAARELREETGIVATAGSPDPLTIARSAGCLRDPEATHWTIGYAFTLDRSADVVGEAGRDVRWFPVDSLPIPRPADIDHVIDARRG